MSSRKVICKNSDLFYNNAKGKKIGRNFKKSFSPKLELLAKKRSHGVYSGRDKFDQFPVRLPPMDNSNQRPQRAPLNRVRLFEKGHSGGSHKAGQVGDAAVVPQVEGGGSQNTQQLFFFRTEKDFKRENWIFMISEKGLKGGLGGSQQQSRFEAGKPAHFHTFPENIQPETGGVVLFRTPGPGVKDHPVPLFSGPWTGNEGMSAGFIHHRIAV
jgi:hypothetical protein